MLGVQLPTGRSRPGRKRKQVQVTEGQGRDEGERLLEFGVGLGGEADHDVRAEGEVRPRGAQQSLDFFVVVPGR